MRNRKRTIKNFATYKAYAMPEDPVHLPLQVGSAIRSRSIGSGKKTAFSPGSGGECAWSRPEDESRQQIQTEEHE